MVDLHQEISERHAVEIALADLPLSVECDPARLEQVLTNLLTNAIKYSPGGGRIVVSADRVGGNAVVTVADTGLGIPPEDRERIFEPFRRGNAGAQNVPGVGLGLSVARRIVRAHQGDIEVESQPGMGSTFRIRLPLLAGLSDTEVKPVAEHHPRA
jgi:signal transduction histidine kinase